MTTRLALLIALLASPLASAQTPDEARLGGPATIRDTTINAFGFPARVLNAKERRAFAVGNAFFKENWVTAPASAAGRDGLGPLFNARSCSTCHLRDGRGRAPEPGEKEQTGLVLRLGRRTDQSDVPHPVYGGQLQDFSVLEVAAEGAIAIRHATLVGAYGDGTSWTLSAPRYEVASPAYGPLDDAVLGPRVAPQLIGLGLLEAIPEATLTRLADPEDVDGDGISGRPHFVVSKRNGRKMIGRFGWKATQPTVEEQTAAAFVNDIGITSPLHPRESFGTKQEIVAASGGSPEMDDHKLGRVAFYCQTLAVPERRDLEKTRVGEALFTRIGCASCHVPQLETGADAVIDDYRNVTIRPYTDLLLHDMGPALADGKHDGEALPSEWRTPPLWGIGLFETVNGHTRYLHDGRARNLEEAVLWHGGEASRAREAFMQLKESERSKLLSFLRSL